MRKELLKQIFILNSNFILHILLIITYLSTTAYDKNHSFGSVLRKDLLTSHMKMSKIRVATGNGKEVRKMVRNHDEAYMEVWKL